MKSTLPLLIAILFSACQKDESIEPVPTEREKVGTWVIVPVGNPQDQYAYKIFSDEDSLYNVLKSGIVSDGGFSISLYRGREYSLWYRNTHGDTVFYDREEDGIIYIDTVVYWHKSVFRQAESGYFVDSIPATIY